MFFFIESANGNGGGEQRVLNEEHLTVSHILSRTQKTQNQQRKRESYFEKYFLVFFIIYHSTNKKKTSIMDSALGLFHHSIILYIL